MESENLRIPMVSIIAKPFWAVTSWLFGRRRGKSKKDRRLECLETSVKVLSRELAKKNQKIVKLEALKKRPLPHTQTNSLYENLHNAAKHSQAQAQLQQNLQGQSYMLQLRLSQQQMNMMQQRQKDSFSADPLQIMGALFGSSFKK